MTNIRLRSLRHKRSSGYAEHQAQLYRNSQTHGGFIKHFSNFCENKIDNGWLAESEHPQILKELWTNIVIIVNTVIILVYCTPKNNYFRGCAL